MVRSERDAQLHSRVRAIKTTCQDMLTLLTQEIEHKNCVDCIDLRQELEELKGINHQLGKQIERDNSDIANLQAKLEMGTPVRGQVERGLKLVSEVVLVDPIGQEIRIQMPQYDEKMPDLVIRVFRRQKI